MDTSNAAFRKNAVEFLRGLRQQGFHVSILSRTKMTTKYEFARGGYNYGTFSLFTFAYRG